jgi:hypothetical protein
MGHIVVAMGSMTTSTPPAKQSLWTTTWFRTKDSLPAATRAGRTVLARDLNQNAAKCFAVFDTPQAAAEFAAQYAKRNPGHAHLYEVIEHLEQPVHMFFDLDRKNKEGAPVFCTEELGQQFLSALEAFLSQKYEAQVCQASRVGKTSLHVRLNVQVESMIEHRYLARHLIAFVILRAAEFPALMIADNETVIDPAVYTSFRSFRMLGMSKWGSDATLKACMQSSECLIDHMVGVYPSLASKYVLVSDYSDGLPKAPGRAATVQYTSAVSTKPECQKYERFLNMQKDVQVTFCSAPVGIESATVDTQTGRVRLMLACSTCCPYAGRVHASNRVYINLHPSIGYAEVECHDAECQQKCKAEGKIDFKDMAMQNTAEHDAMLGHNSMHAQYNNIKWTENYDEPYMRKLPVAPIVCVRAGMGLGKSEAIADLLQEQCAGGVDETRVLIVTFSRALADKAHEDFRDLGFTNYQAEQGVENRSLNQTRIVVCLDSLYRVVTRNFDFIIIDEACSVMLHYNSPLMKQSCTNALRLELLVNEATHVYFVDAMLDTTFMKNVIDFFCTTKSVQALWICNKHVRPSNRKVHLVTDSAGLSAAIRETSMVFRAARKVLDQLDAGQRVVCCSSTKKFTEVLEKYISQQRPETRIKVLNSASSTSTASSERLPGITADWHQYDLLVYSPSISAGVSFTAPHFDCLVGYLVNSRYTPSVDIALQQLFRVRQLKAGDMYLFVQDNKPTKPLPDTMDKVSAALGVDISLVNSALVSTQMKFNAQVTSRDGAIKYDTERVSYRVIMGIVLASNRSAMYYTSLLMGTLRQDYGLLVSHTQADALADARAMNYDVDLAIVVDAAKPKEIPDYSQVPLLNAEAYDLLKPTAADASSVQLASLKLYEGMTDRWGVQPQHVDAGFYKQYVMASNAHDLYFQAKRFNALCMSSLTDNKERYASQLRVWLAMDDYNLELYRSRMRNFHETLLSGQTLLIALMDLKDRDTLCALGSVQLHEDVLDARFNKYWSALQPPVAVRTRKIFKLINNKGAYYTVKKVLDHAFGISMSRGNKNADRPAFKQLTVRNAKMKAMVSRYHPTFPAL